MPPRLGAIVLKMLAKDPQDRYQTAAGLMADLRECLQQYNATGKIVGFPVARLDLAGTLLTPRRYYGRGRERAAIAAALRRVSEGGTEVLLVSGEAGLGKSALVLHTLAGALDGRGLFVTGKGNPLRRDIPYLALARAFKGLFDWFLVRPEREFTVFKNEIRESVTGSEGGDMVLCEFARRLSASVREGDIVARIGGDEFVNLLAGLKEAQSAAALAERLLENLKTPMNIDGRPVRISTSIGIAVLGEKTVDPEE